MRKQINKTITVRTTNENENRDFLMIKPIKGLYVQLNRNVLKTINTNAANKSQTNIRLSNTRSSDRSTKVSQKNSQRVSTGRSARVQITVQMTNQNQNTEQQKIQCTNEQNFNKLPNITSKCWGVYELKSQKFIYGKQTKKQIEVASLTKIMNLVTIVSIIETYSLNPKQIKVAVSEWASSMVGTSANLRKKDVVSLEDLMYGMMLPSGNDAAFQIAMLGGTILKLVDLARLKKIYDKQQIETLTQCRSNTVRYLFQMNRISRKIGMSKSKWVNPHGLSNKQNRTTIEDMCILCQTAMENDYIRNIVNTKYYTCIIESYFRVQGVNSRAITWQNTNKMLWKGWNGIKTGVTPNAGPCLSASFPITHNNKTFQFLVIIANCFSMEQRWKQVQLIAEWAIKKFKNFN